MGKLIGKRLKSSVCLLFIISTILSFVVSSNAGVFTATPDGASVSFFEADNYIGQVQNFSGIGRGYFGAFKDRISSIKVKPGYYVKVYVDDGWVGNYKKLDPGDYPSLRTFNYNDVINSFEVFKSSTNSSGEFITSENGASVSFYDALYFGGASQHFQGAGSGYFGAFKDRISSIKVAKGFKVTVYVDDNFGGKALLYKAGKHYNLSRNGFNDCINSFKVVKATTSTTSTTTTSKPITFYTGANFTGSRFDVAFVGTKNLPSSWQNKVSSLKVKTGYKVWLYKGIGQQGTALGCQAGSCKTLVFRNFSYDNAIKSYKVFRVN